MWIYTVYSDNEEIIHFIKDKTLPLNNIEEKEEKKKEENLLVKIDYYIPFEQAFIESIKCHHIMMFQIILLAFN